MNWKRIFRTWLILLLPCYLGGVIMGQGLNPFEWDIAVRCTVGAICLTAGVAGAIFTAWMGE